MPFTGLIAPFNRAVLTYCSDASGGITTPKEFLHLIRRKCQVCANPHPVLLIRLQRALLGTPPMRGPGGLVRIRG